MRTSQIKLRFEVCSELAKTWTMIPETERMTIARHYARLLIKAAKIDLPGTEHQQGSSNER